MWARVIGVLVVFGLLAFVLMGAMHAMSQIQERLAERGVMARSPTPLQGLREAVQGWVKTVTYWGTIAVVGVFGATAAITVARAVARSGRLLGVIPVRDFQRHLLILGPTGSGKTNTAKKAIELAVRRGVRVVVLDWKAHPTMWEGPERRVHRLYRECDDS